MKAKEKYGCGHKPSLIVVSNKDPTIFSSYFNWKNTVGFDGDKSMCFPCYCKKQKNGGDVKYE